MTVWEANMVYFEIVVQKMHKWIAVILLRDSRSQTRLHQTWLDEVLFAYASFNNTTWFGNYGCVYVTKHTAAAAAAI